MHILALLLDPNIPKSVEKNRSPSQLGEFTGVVHDIVLERFFIPDKKLATFVLAAQSVLH